MDSVQLLNRKDTKYYFHVQKLPAVLELLQRDYRLLDIRSTHSFSYCNLYFDTPDFYFYYQHHNRRLNRYKIRIRHYLESDITYLEIKFRSNNSRIIKTRLQIPSFCPELSEESKQFIRLNSPCDPDTLRPVLRNDFKRLTFVSNDMKERGTIDTRLTLEAGGGQKEFQSLCIAEIKQNTMFSGSRFKVAMRECLCPELKISKYSIGTAYMYPHLKQNNFKPKKLRINRIEHDPTYIPLHR